MKLLSGRHLELPEHEFHSPDSDRQIIFGELQRSFLMMSCVLLVHQVHASWLSFSLFLVTAPSPHSLSSQLRTQPRVRHYILK